MNQQVTCKGNPRDYTQQNCFKKIQLKKYKKKPNKARITILFKSHKLVRETLEHLIKIG